MMLRRRLRIFSNFFFFNDTATTEIYTLSLHDALPISFLSGRVAPARPHFDSSRASALRRGRGRWRSRDRKSTRLNSSHQIISYAVFCLKKKKELENQEHIKKPLADEIVCRIRTDCSHG